MVIAYIFRFLIIIIITFFINIYNYSQGVMVTEAIILAGGFGTRLKNVLGHSSKPMALIGNKPFLEYQLNYLIENGIQKVIISIGYRKELIIEYFGLKYKSINICMRLSI